ncbi:MchS3 family protein [Herbaspirillum sp. LeCh32-8]|uniref:MchS3 family protein n=1 Tax=Herbaspirillum sp. LeCh32-8 TaxID=2821356 RepID=UPI001AE88FE7|nr:MchS3 family protein [Herbaspirillum sp. LeCh32-8]
MNRLINEALRRFSYRKCLMIAAFAYPALLAQAGEIPASEITVFEKTNVFALGQVGFVAHISEGEVRYRAIMQSDGALATLTRILSSPTASPEARLYAACGIRQLSPADFYGLTQELRNSGLSASVLRTDILKREPVNQLLNRIRAYGCAAPATMFPDTPQR